MQDCVAQQFERWDGKGPYGMAQDEVALPVRVGEVATQAVLFLDAAGPEAALAMVVERAGGWFDPDVAAAFGQAGPRLMDELVEAGQEIEPARACSLFSDMVELQGAPPGSDHTVNVAPTRENPLAVTGQMCSSGRFTSVMVANEAGLEKPLPLEPVTQALRAAHRNSLG